VAAFVNMPIAYHAVIDLSKTGGWVIKKSETLLPFLPQLRQFTKALLHLY
jgi:hypothetical protein